MKVAINIAFCCQHFKGGDPGVAPQLDGAEHAEWLAEAVQFYKYERPDWDLVIVSITGFPGWPDVPAGRERDALWKAYGMSKFVTMSSNPGHQVGAGWCIRLGLEAAGKWGYDYMIHTAEDVLPHKGRMNEMIYSVGRDGAEYCGELWGIHKNELNSQFFACRVPYLAGVFDPPAVGGAGHLELYLANLLREKRVAPIDRAYDHTHDFAEWRRLKDRYEKQHPS